MLSSRFIDFNDFTHVQYKAFLSDAEIIHKNELHVEQEVKSGYDHLISVLNDFKSTTEYDTAMLNSKVDSLNLNLKGIEKEISDVIATHLNFNCDVLKDGANFQLQTFLDKISDIEEKMLDIGIL